MNRRDRLIRESEHDPYRARRKPPGPVSCPDCGAVFRDGRWQWAASEGPPFAPAQPCPACQRIRDGYPAGYVTLQGDFWGEHREEVLGLARNVEARESTYHPLKRIIEARETDQGLEITTTDTHLARSIGDALHRAYEGELDYTYSKGENILRVRWRR